MKEKIERVGPYRLLSTLGQGGMGIVYLAVHEDTGEQVALKTIQVPNASLLGGIRREIQALSRLRHPNIVKIIEEGVEGGIPWYAMELIAGVDLRRWLSSDADPAMLSAALTAPFHPARTLLTIDPQPSYLHAERSQLTTRRDSPSVSSARFSSLVALAYRLCTPLAFLHGEGLIHRDLKPENILVRADGAPVLVDFGLATQGFAAISRERLTIERGMAGTVYYMSPEQIHREALDARADLYSLGVILYELFTGRRPFLGETPMAVITAHLQQEPALPSSLEPTLPPALDELIMGLLQKRRHQRRPGFAEDVAKALAAISPVRPMRVEPRHNPRPYLYRPSLAGRTEELTQWRRALGKLQQGSGGLWLLSGESGVGKTRLASEFAKEASRLGFRVLTGEAYERETRPPLGLLRKPLQEISDRARELGVEGSDRLFGFRGKVLSHYEAQISTLPGQEAFTAPAELAPEATRLRLYSFLGETLFAFAQDRPLVLLLDDLQWADELSLGFLHFFLRIGPLSRCLLIVGTYRSEEESAALLALRSTPEVKSLVVERLQGEDITRMIGEMLAHPPDPAFGRFLAEHSEGNPFFIAEYIKASVEEGFLARDEQGWRLTSPKSAREYANLPLPEALQDVIARRLAGLPHGAERVLSAAAVLGREVARAHLEKLAGVALNDALDELRCRQLLEETEAGSLRFVHDKLRAGAYQRLSATTRAALHRWAAEALTGHSSSELGHHWEQANEPVQARACYLEGARRAAALHHHQEAEGLYRAYLRLSPTITAERITARSELGEKILQVTGRVEENLKNHQQALDEANQLGDRRAIANSLRLLGAGLFRAGRLAEALDHTEDAMALFHELGEARQEGVCAGNLASIYAAQGGFEEAKRFSLRALALYRKIGDRLQEGIGLGNLAKLYQDLGKQEDALELYEQTLPIFQEMGYRRGEGAILGNLANLASDRGQDQEALGLYRRTLAIFQEIGDRRFEGALLGNLATTLLEQGELVEARALYTKAIEILRSVGDQRLLGMTLKDYALLEVWSGDEGQAEASFREAEELLTRAGDKTELGRLWCGRAQLALCRGEDPSQALRRAQEITRAVKSSPEGQLTQDLNRVERAYKASVTKEAPLLRGVLREDIPQPLLKRLQRELEHTISE